MFVNVEKISKSVTDSELLSEMGQSELLSLFKTVYIIYKREQKGLVLRVSCNPIEFWLFFEIWRNIKAREVFYFYDFWLVSNL